VVQVFRKRVFEIEHLSEFGVQWRPGSSSALPEMFDFVGILRDIEKERKERAEACKSSIRNRLPSPRESFFEMSHPMGWWNQSRMGF
jgi:hypothetical protein